MDFCGEVLIFFYNNIKKPHVLHVILQFLGNKKIKSPEEESKILLLLAGNLRCLLGDPMGAPSITSQELNFLVFRYLQESGHLLFSCIGFQFWFEFPEFFSSIKDQFFSVLRLGLGFVWILEWICVWLCYFDL